MAAMVVRGTGVHHLGPPSSFPRDMSPLTDFWLSPAVATALFWAMVVACAVSQLFIMRAVFRTLPDAPTNSAVPAPRRWAEIVQVLLPIAGLVTLFLGAWRALPS
jgi:hypothetical protein